VNAREVIHELESLPPDQQAEVIQFAYRLDAKRKLSGPELSALAERMTVAASPDESLKLRAEIVRGFYGTDADA
jgi:hypothetical protein